VAKWGLEKVSLKSFRHRVTWWILKIVSEVMVSIVGTLIVIFVFDLVRLPLNIVIELESVKAPVWMGIFVLIYWKTFCSFPKTPVKPVPPKSE